nr:30S ribosomal protein S9 [Candidatus Gracilibacteria bacterium]
MNKGYDFSIGKRKTATAQIKLFEGNKESTINGKKVGEYITREDLFDVIFAPLKVCKVKDNFFFEVEVVGSGISAQAQAIRHGLSRSLAGKQDTFKKILKSAGFLTRDSRVVERKKPGKHKARKGIQWSKR